MATAGNVNVTVTADTRKLRVALLRMQIEILRTQLATLEADLEADS